MAVLLVSFQDRVRPSGYARPIVNKKNDSARTDSVAPRPLGIVTVTYSPGPYLESLIESVAQATSRPTRIIAADNGSTDGAPQAAAAAHSNVEFLDTGGNIGYGGAMNAGERFLSEHGQADPEFLLLVNPDVTFGPGSIDALIDCAKRWPRAGSVGPRIVEPDGNNYPSARALPNLKNGIGHALLGSVWPGNPFSRAYRDDADMSMQRPAGWLSGSCLLVRREAFSQVGGFDERYFMYLEDVDLGDRLARAGWHNVFCPEAAITHAQGHSTKVHAGPMLRAHHASAYQYLADRHPQWWQAPLRAALWLGLRLRALLTSYRARLSR